MESHGIWSSISACCTVYKAASIPCLSSVLLLRMPIFASVNHAILNILSAVGLETSQSLRWKSLVASANIYNSVPVWSWLLVVLQLQVYSRLSCGGCFSPLQPVYQSLPLSLSLLWTLFPPVYLPAWRSKNTYIAFSTRHNKKAAVVSGVRNREKPASPVKFKSQCTLLLQILCYLELPYGFPEEKEIADISLESRGFRDGCKYSSHSSRPSAVWREVHVKAAGRLLLSNLSVSDE